MNRDELVDRIATIGESYAPIVRGDAEDMAYAILDDILPQVLTRDDLERLPIGALILTKFGGVARKGPYDWSTEGGTYLYHDEMVGALPATVLVQP